MSKAKQKFSAQADPTLLKAIRELSRQKGRQLHSLIDEAFRDVIEKHNGTTPRPHVMAHYQASLEKYGPLYERLAK